MAYPLKTNSRRDLYRVSSDFLTQPVIIFSEIQTLPNMEPGEAMSRKMNLNSISVLIIQTVYFRVPENTTKYYRVRSTDDVQRLFYRE